jgi:selenocysteine lyase/cysteine desulfurase
VVLRWVNLQLPTADDDYLCNSYTDLFTDKTKLVQLTHMINWTGQIIPVRRIAEAAHARGIEVMVDAAHTFAHIDHKISDLDCDYYGTSLQKWLGAPFGSGMLYVKKEKISSIWPLLSSYEPRSSDIRKLEMLGTRNFASEMAIHQALSFTEAIGVPAKEARLRYLKNYWTQQVKDFPGVKVGTPFEASHCGGLAMFSIEGIEPMALEERILKEFDIHVVGMTWENIQGVRVTPHLFTTPAELDRLVNAITQIALSLA